jgi:hypothetical protein
MPIEFPETVETAKQSVRIAWWNTHLSPPKGKNLPLGEKGLVIDIIIQILSNCDIFFLGEVSSADISWLSQQLAGTRFAIKDMSKSSNGSKFHIGVIYREDVARYIEHEFLISNIGGDNYRISCKADFTLYDEDYFSFLVCHWPSRLFKRDDAEIRSHYGEKLREQFETIQSKDIKYLIVLGDFNDEPYNNSMTRYLRGCRDAVFVRQNPSLLYNPFWKQISCPIGYVKSADASTPTGTYFYKSDNLHRWRVFDQMLFCSSFVGGSQWHLNECRTGVFRFEPLVEAVESTRSKLDHLPIIAEVNKEKSNG